MKEVFDNLQIIYFLGSGRCFKQFVKKQTKVCVLLVSKSALSIIRYIRYMGSSIIVGEAGLMKRARHKVLEGDAAHLSYVTVIYMKKKPT